jgi:hypothetical protein
MATSARFPLVAYRRRDVSGLLAFARACAARDAAAPYPDAESGPSEPPFETVIARHAAVWGERLGRGYHQARSQAWRSVEDARAGLAGRELDRAAARGALARAEAAQAAAAADLRIAADPSRHFAPLGGSWPVRAAIVGVGSLAEALTLTPARNGLGNAAGLFLLVATVGAGSLLLTGQLARQARDGRFAARRRHLTGLRAGVGRTARGHALTDLSPAAVAGSAVVAAAAGMLAVTRVWSAGGGLPAFGMFLALQAVLTAVVAAVEYHGHDPLAAAARRADRLAERARGQLRAAEERSLRADAAERAAVREAIAAVTAFRELFAEERARLEVVRDSYRADLVARCDVERAAALAALPRKPWPVPGWLDELADEILTLAARQRPPLDLDSLTGAGPAVDGPAREGARGPALPTPAARHPEPLTSGT